MVNLGTQSGTVIIKVARRANTPPEGGGGHRLRIAAYAYQDVHVWSAL